MLLVHIVPCDEDILTLGNEYEYFYINFVPHSWDTETNKVEFFNSLFLPVKDLSTKQNIVIIEIFLS